MTEPATPGAPIFREIRTDSKPERVYRFRSVKGLSYAVVAVGGLYELTLVTQLIGLASGASSDSIALAALGELLTLLTAYVIGAVWIYNAACNARALGARGLQISPGWAVGWYFVPLMSLFKPFQGMEEIWTASASAAGWRSQRTPALLRWWWGAWLLANVAGAAVFRLPDAPSLLRVVDLGLDAVAAALFVVIVWRVSQMQAARIHQVAQVFD